MKITSKIAFAAFLFCLVMFPLFSHAVIENTPGFGGGMGIASGGQFTNIGIFEPIVGQMSSANVLLKNGFLGMIPFSDSVGTVMVEVEPDIASWTFVDGNGGTHTGTGDTTVNDVPIGNIILTWDPLPGYDSPILNPEIQTLAMGDTITFSGIYSKINHPPVANIDFYFYNKNETLIVSATGVLSNDTDDDGDILQAIYGDVPDYGILNGNADGSFTYTPGPASPGMDVFGYKAYDGKEYSEETPVMLLERGTLSYAVAWPGTSAYFDAIISVTSPLLGSGSAQFPAWCADMENMIDLNTNYPGSDAVTHPTPQVFVSFTDLPPAGLGVVDNPNNLGYVNRILNDYRVGAYDHIILSGITYTAGWREVQAAIWKFLYNGMSDVDPKGGITSGFITWDDDVANWIYADALAQGILIPNDNGQIIGIVVYLGDKIQTTLLEMPFELYIFLRILGIV